MQNNAKFKDMRVRFERLGDRLNNMLNGKVETCLLQNLDDPVRFTDCVNKETKSMEELLGKVQLMQAYNQVFFKKMSEEGFKDEEIADMLIDNLNNGIDRLNSQIDN